MNKQKPSIPARNPLFSIVAILGIALAPGCASSVDTLHDASPVNQVEAGDHEITDIENGNGSAEETTSKTAVAIVVLGIILALDTLGVGDAD